MLVHLLDRLGGMTDLQYGPDSADHPVRIAQVLPRDKDDFPARGVQSVESFPVRSDLQRRAVPHPVILDGEPMARESEIGGSHPSTGVIHPELHLRAQPVEYQVYPKPGFGPRFSPRISELQCAPRLHDAAVMPTRHEQLHL
jgi:hypothetical protein